CEICRWCCACIALRRDHLEPVDPAPALLRAGSNDTRPGGSLSVLDCYSVTRPKSYHLNKVKK
ncbi:MAG: hypothetical protein QMC17_03710, partial [Paracoccaceae bacterium]